MIQAAIHGMCCLQDPVQTVPTAEPAQAAAAAEAGAASAKASAAAAAAAEASAAALAATASAPCSSAAGNDSLVHDGVSQPPAPLEGAAPPQLSDVVLPDVQPGNGYQTPAVCPRLVRRALQCM